ncbi:MAG: hypothetical protein H0U58_06025 [Chloroflexi bacterium]|nr:hypothetical protein [Chloroflexota bacterium]
MAHRVGVSEANVELDAVGEVPREVARVERRLNPASNHHPRWSGFRTLDLLAAMVAAHGGRRRTLPDAAATPGLASSNQSGRPEIAGQSGLGARVRPGG